MNSKNMKDTKGTGTQEKTKHRIVGAYATTAWVPSAVSQALRDLGISHTIVGHNPSSRWYDQLKVRGTMEDPPAWPVVCHSVADIRRYKPTKPRSILFVTDGNAHLSQTNLQLLDHSLPLIESIKLALLTPWWDSWTLVQQDTPYSEYVKMASRPSFLRDLQTEVYKIQPYADQKNVQAQSISYLAGRISYRELQNRIKPILKATRVLELLKEEAANILIGAVKRADEGQELPQAIADSVGIDVFDINYVRASMQKQLQKPTDSKPTRRGRPKSGIVKSSSL